MTTPVVRLEEVAAFVRGITFKPTDVVLPGTSGAVPCMRTKNVQAELTTTDVWSVDRSLVRRSEQFLRHGDTLVSSANSWNLVGKCCWIPELKEPTSFGGFISVLRPHRNKIDPRYLFRWFSSDRVQATVRSFGQKTTSISNLNLSRCLSLPIPIPPLEEQQRIAAILDQAEGLRAKRREALAHLDDLTTSIFLDMFGDPASSGRWTRQPLKDMTVVITKGTTPTSVGFQFSDSGVPFVRVQNLVNGTVDFAPGALFIENTTHAALRRSRILAGDILVSIAGTIGRTSIVPLDAQEMNCNQAVAIVRLKEGENRDFVRTWLSSPDAHRQVSASAVTATISNLSLKQLGALQIVQPPASLQERFSERLRSTATLNDRCTESHFQIETLVTSLQSRAFAGEL